MKEKDPLDDLAGQFRSEASYTLFRLIVEHERTDPDNIQIRTVLMGVIVAHTVMAFETLNYDFIDEIEEHIELVEGLDALTRWIDFFDARATFLDDPSTGRSQVFYFPVLASTSYGIPFGKIPTEILAFFYETLREVLSPHFELRLNDEYLPEAFLRELPCDMHARLKTAVAKTQPGICSFWSAQEKPEDMADVLADIRYIAFIFTEFPHPGKAHKMTRRIMSRRLRIKLTMGLKKLFEEHYLATRFWFPALHGEELDAYLKKFGGDERYPEDVFMPAPYVFYEAQKLFRHLSLQTALKNLREDDGLQVEDLVVSIARFFEFSPSGQTVLLEYRLGFCRKTAEEEPLFGVDWPVFSMNEGELRENLVAILRHLGFPDESIAIHEEVNSIEDDDEERLYPAFSGRLVELTYDEQKRPVAPKTRILN